MMSAEKLIMRIALGERNAFEKLYNGYFKLAFATAWSITQNKSDAEDVTAEVFVTVWKKADTFRGGNGKSWLCMIAKNLALTLVSKRKREAILTDDMPCENEMFEGNVSNKILVENALSILSEKERETVLMFNSGLKHREIAEINDEKLGTVTWRYNIALKKMRNYLEGEK